jgi:DNA-binding NtrC family response regulator
MSIRILIADDERAARYGLAKALASAGHTIVEATNGLAAVEAIRAGGFDLVFLDLNMPGLDGIGVLRELCGKDAAGAGLADIVVLTADDRIQTAVECVRLGAADYLTKPYEVEHVRAIARRVAQRVELQGQVRNLQEQLDHRHAFGALIGVSRPMRDLYARIEKIAAAPVDVLIRGDTGTGKELIARELHRLSPRSKRPFVAVNTAAIAESLAESELFGHVKGSFTGATADRKGVFEQADGGTLFLDEIGDMPLPAQTKILRALQERTIQPVGSAKQVRVDVRVITATHQDLNKAIADGHFRQDLFFRIKGIELQVPPLRHRREDIILLADYFLSRAANDGQTRRLSAGAVDALLRHAWPGNVRELEHVITAASALAASDEIASADLGLSPPRDDQSATSDGLLIDGISMDSLLSLPLTEARDRLVAAFEKVAINRALDQHERNVSAAARALGIHRQNLQQKMEQLGIRR